MMDRQHVSECLGRKVSKCCKRGAMHKDEKGGKKAESFSAEEKMQEQIQKQW